MTVNLNIKNDINTIMHYDHGLTLEDFKCKPILNKWQQNHEDTMIIIDKSYMFEPKKNLIKL